MRTQKVEEVWPSNQAQNGWQGIRYDISRRQQLVVEIRRGRLGGNQHGWPENAVGSKSGTFYNEDIEKLLT